MVEMTNTNLEPPHSVDATATPSLGGDGGGIEERLSSIESHMKHVATKKELAELRGDLKQDMTEFRGEIKVEMTEFRGEIKVEMAEFRGEIRESLLQVRIWVLGGVVGALLAGIPAGMYLVVNFLEK